MVRLKYKGDVSVRVLNLLFKPGEEMDVTAEAAWTILNQSGQGKDFQALSGQPVRPNLVPARFVGRMAMDLAMRIPDERAVSELPGPIPEDIRQSLVNRNWKNRLPSLIERHHAASLAQWCALSGHTEQAEAILAAVTVNV
jgi:hypothetical protein